MTEPDQDLRFAHLLVHPGRVACSSPDRCPSLLILSDSQDEGAAGSTTRAGKSGGVPTRSIDCHGCCSQSRDQGGRDHGLQLLTAYGLSCLVS
jgi:hypothetical protein